MTIRPLREQLIVPRVSMANVRADRQLDRVRIELACGFGTANPAGVRTAGMVRNRPALEVGTTRKRIPQSPGKRAHVLRVDLLPTLGRSLAGSLARLGIGEALAFCPLERRLLDQHPLTLVSPPSPTESHDDRVEGRVLGGASRQSRIAAAEVYEMREVGALEAERPFPFHAEKTPLAELTPAFHARQVPEDREHDDVARINASLTVALWLPAVSQ